MINIKIGGIAAGAAFVLSLLIGLISGAGIPVIFLRAGIFAVFFFALSWLVQWLLSRFLPELLEENESSDDLDILPAGSRVDISVGDGPVTGAFPADNSESVDDIAGVPSTPAKTVSSPLDQNGNTGYTKQPEDVEDLTNPDNDAFGGLIGGAGNPVFGTVGAAGSGAYPGGEILPDLEGLAENAPENNEEIADDVASFNAPEERRPLSTSKNPGIAKDFDAREIAKGIQTLLKKDEKG